MMFHQALNQSKQAGTSLIGVMVGVAVILIAAAAAARGFSSIVAARRNVAASAAVLESQDVIVQAVAQSLKTFVTNQCAIGAAAPLMNLSLGNLGNLMLTPHINLPASFPGTSASGDVARCSASYMPGAGVANALYACYQLTVPPQVAAHSDAMSFAKNRGAFVEVLMHVKDMRTDAAALCNAMSAGAPGYGIEVYYAIHWTMNNNQGLMYKSRVGSVDVSL